MLYLLLSEPPWLLLFMDVGDIPFLGVLYVLLDVVYVLLGIDDVPNLLSDGNDLPPQSIQFWIVVRREAFLVSAPVQSVQPYLVMAVLHQ